MALITRLSRLLTADFHAVLDRMEEPDILLQQAIREMETDLLERETGIKQLHQQRKRLVTRRDEITKDIQEIQNELSICLDSGNEDLARILIRRKLEAEAFTKHATSQLQDWETKLLEAQARFNEDQAQLESMRQKAEVFCHKTENQDAPLSETLVTENDVEVALLKEKHLREAS